MSLRTPITSVARVAAAGALSVGLSVLGQARAHEAAIRIELRPLVEVKSAQVTLGEVATIDTQDPEALSQLKALPLGKAPPGGGAVNLGRGSLERWIQARAGIEPGRIRWSGAWVTSIRSATQKALGDQIASSAQAFLLKAYEATDLRVEVGLTQTPEGVSVPAGHLKMKARPQSALQPPALEGDSYFRAPANPLLSKHQSVWVDLWVDGRFIRTVPVGFDVRVFAPAYVAAEDMAAPDLLDPGKLKVQEVEWTGRCALPVRAKAKDAGASGEGMPAMKLRHPLAAGETLTQMHVEPAPLVTQGGYATLHAVQGSIELESRVEVLQDAFLGQSVMVKLPNASSAIRARVVGRGLVEVRE